MDLLLYAKSGQGIKSISDMIGEFFLNKGYNVKIIPEYIAARFGTPMKVTIRISQEKLYSYNTIQNPDLLIILDKSLIDLNLIKNIKENGILLFNSEFDQEQFNKIKSIFKGDIYYINANKINLEYFNEYRLNTIFYGSLSYIFKNLYKEDYLTNFIELFKLKFLKKLNKENLNKQIELIKYSYKNTFLFED